jgi:glycosidase
MTRSVWSLLLWLIGSIGHAQETQDPAKDLIYFILVDRFANGAEDTEGDINSADLQAFHGGDLQGIIDRLDHLQAMGIQTLWISPVAQIQTEKIGPWGAYHGYWITDHAQVDPRFGDFETLERLSTALHARGMRLVLDMVYNHVGPSSALVTEKPEWFHPTGDIVDWSDPVERRTHRVHGLPDLNQDHPEVFQYLTDVTQSWLEKTGADGIRIDAIGHMEPRFVASLQSELRER